MLRGMFKKLRNTQPLNYIATTLIRTAFNTEGGPPEVIVKHLPRNGIVQSRLPNGRVIRLWSRGDDWIANQVFWKGWYGYEPETSSVFFELAKRSRVIIDVGAHIGYYSILAALANPDAKIFAFEPLPQAAQRFKRNIKENRLANISLLEFAIGDATGAATLFHIPDSSESIPSSSGLSQTFFQSPYYLEQGVVAGAVVEVKTLDEVASTHMIPHVDLVKIDTETTEPAVIAGMSKTIERDRPEILFEVLPGQGTGPVLTQQLRSLGYKFYLLRDTGPEERDEVESHPCFWNYLARVTNN